MDTEKPSYYAIIPSEIRYCKELPANAKLLYGEITCLSNKEGYCWASNGYFAKLYGVNKATVSRWVSALEKMGKIRTKIFYKEDNKTVDRRTIVLTESSIPIDEIINTPIDDFVHTPIDEIVIDNSTRINTTSKNIKTNREREEIPLKDSLNGDRGIIPPLPEWVTNYAQDIGYTLQGDKFCDFYAQKGWLVGKNKMKDWQAAVRTWKARHIEQNPEQDPNFDENLPEGYDKTQDDADRAYIREDLVFSSVLGRPVDIHHPSVLQVERDYFYATKERLGI